ncbi:hypothetical protein ABFS83_14G026300 [Erythranthe nasuta]
MNHLLMPLTFLTLISSCFAISSPEPVQPPTTTRPPPEKAAVFARWLVAESSWGVLATLDAGSGSPFGNVVSFSDASTGVPYFYLSTKLDPTGPNALSNNQSSFTISEYELGTCNKEDPQSPICAKITLSGQLHLLPNNTKEAMSAEEALFAKHHQLAGWPKKNGSFRVFKLVIADIFLVNLYAPKRNLTVRDYLRVPAA